MSTRTRLRAPAGRLGKWLGGSIILALAGWSAVSAAQFGWRKLTTDEIPPLDVQVANLYQRTAREGLRTVTTRLVNLRGTAQPSRLIVLHRQGRAVRFRGSDELRVYDVVGEKLHLTFKFVPRLAGRPKGTHHYLPRRGFKIEMLNAFDANALGRQEVALAFAQYGRRVGSYAVLYSTHAIILAWNPLTDRYELIPLLDYRRRRTLKLGPTSGFALYGSRRFYRTPLRIVDADSGAALVSHPVWLFSVVKTEDGVLLVAGYDLGKRQGGDEYRLKTWRVLLDGSEPPVVPCTRFQSDWLDLPGRQVQSTAEVRALLSRYGRRIDTCA